MFEPARPFDAPARGAAIRDDHTVGRSCEGDNKGTSEAEQQAGVEHSRQARQEAAGTIDQNPAKSEVSTATNKQRVIGTFGPALIDSA